MKAIAPRRRIKGCGVEKLILSLLFLTLACGTSAASVPESTSCIGPQAAKKFFIYLHGVDSNPPSQQELNNRALLEKVAQQKNIRIALPRASMTCPNQPNSYCWGWRFDQDELSKILPMIMDSRKACFNENKPFGLIGFSNGGYLLTQLYAQKMSALSNLKPTLLIAVGSGKGPFSPADLSKNPPLVLVIGKQDPFNYDPKEEFFHELQSSKAPVRLIEFDGGHSLELNSLIEALGI